MICTFQSVSSSTFLLFHLLSGHILSVIHHGSNVPNFHSIKRTSVPSLPPEFGQCVYKWMYVFLSPIQDSRPTLISAIEDCVYTFLWLTAAACPLNGTQHGDCKVTNPATGQTFKQISSTAHILYILDTYHNLLSCRSFVWSQHPDKGRRLHCVRPSGPQEDVPHEHLWKREQRWMRSWHRYVHPSSDLVTFQVFII